jgi:hypothetical protein
MTNDQDMAGKPGVAASQYVPDVAQIEHPLGGNKSTPNIGEVQRAKDDGRPPMEDHNTRVIVFGRDGAEARMVAEAVTAEASTMSRSIAARSTRCASR